MVALALLAACGDGGGGDGDPEALGGEEAQRAVERTMLTAEELGDGWELTGTTPPQDDDGTDIDDCLSDEVATASDDPLAESDAHEFARGVDSTQQQQLQITSIVFDDAELAAGLVDELATPEVQTCLRETFQDEVSGEATDEEVTVELAPFEAVDDFADAGDGATRLHADVELSTAGLTLPATVDLVVVRTGQVTTAMVGFAIGEPISDEDLDRWAERLADLQAG